MIVYRIEDSKGRGPYRRNDVKHVLPGWDACDFNYRHPCPMDDHGLREWWLDLGHGMQRESYVCGFRDIKQLVDWFHKQEWMDRLQEAGYSLTTYEVDAQTVQFGDSQLMFVQGDARLVEKLPLPRCEEICELA